jgi:hypothetical protein
MAPELSTSKHDSVAAATASGVDSAIAGAEAQGEPSWLQRMHISSSIVAGDAQIVRHSMDACQYLLATQQLGSGLELPGLYVSSARRFKSSPQPDDSKAALRSQQVHTRLAVTACQARSDKPNWVDHAVCCASCKFQNTQI